MTIAHDVYKQKLYNTIVIELQLKKLSNRKWFWKRKKLKKKSSSSNKNFAGLKKKNW